MTRGVRALELSDTVHGEMWRAWEARSGTGDSSATAGAPLEETLEHLRHLEAAHGADEAYKGRAGRALRKAVRLVGLLLPLTTEARSDLAAAEDLVSDLTDVVRLLDPDLPANAHLYGGGYFASQGRRDSRRSRPFENNDKKATADGQDVGDWDGLGAMDAVGGEAGVAESAAQDSWGQDGWN